MNTAVAKNHHPSERHQYSSACSIPDSGHSTSEEFSFRIFSAVSEEHNLRSPLGPRNVSPSFFCSFFISVRDKKNANIYIEAW